MIVERGDIDAELEYLRKIAEAFSEFDPAMAAQSSSVGTDSSVVMGGNDARKYAIIVNDSAHTIYIGLGSVARVNEGIRLNGGGGAYEITSLNLYKGTVSAISKFAGCNVTLIEG